MNWRKWWSTITGERRRRLALLRIYRNDQEMERMVLGMEKLVDECPPGRERLHAINDLYHMRHTLTVIRIRSSIGEATEYVSQWRKARGYN